VTALRPRDFKGFGSDRSFKMPFEQMATLFMDGYEDTGSHLNP